MVGLMVVYLGRIREKKSPKNESKFLFLHLLTAILGHRLKLPLLLWCHPIVLATTSFVWIPHATSLITGMWHISTILRGLSGRLIQFTIARIHIAPSLGTPSLVLSRFLSFLAAHVVSVIVPGLTISCKVGGVIDRGIGIQLHRRLAIQTSETNLVSETKNGGKKTNETKVTNEYLNIQLSKGDVRNINNYINCWNCADVRYSELHVLKRSNVGFWPPNIKVSPIGIPIMNGTQEDRHWPTMTNWSGWII